VRNDSTLGVVYHGSQHKGRERGDCKHHILVDKLRYTWKPINRSQDMMQKKMAWAYKSKDN